MAPPPTQHAIKYAVHIITLNFGEAAANVCECLLRKGPLSQREIIRFCKIKHLLAINVLYLLTQHNCIQAFAVEQPGEPGSETKHVVQYIVLFDNIIHRMRFNKFLRVVKEDLGEQCEEVLMALFEHGRLTLRQLFERAKEKDNALNLDAVQDLLQKLVTAHFVERAPAAEPVLAAPTDEEMGLKKRGPKSKVLEEPQTLEHRVLEAAMPVESVRFTLMVDTEVDPDGDKNGINSSGMVSGVKRKLDDIESNKELFDMGEQGVIWRPNFEEFVRRLRHKACVQNVKARLDDGAATVLRAMLEATRSQEKKVKIEKSASISVSSIYEEVIKSEEGRNMTLERVETSLDQLTSTSSPFVEESDQSYKIVFKDIIELAQNEEVESLVLKRYGREAYRMFRLLSKSGRFLETDKIADTTFVEKKDAPRILNKLWTDNYLHMEKLIVTGSKQTNFQLWKINKLILLRNVSDEMFHASLNLSLRLADEIEQVKEIINIPMDKLDGETKERRLRHRERRKLLESSRNNLDDALMLFHDF